MSSLIEFCVLLAAMFTGLCFYRLVSGDYMPIRSIAAATLAGILTYTISGWLIWHLLPKSMYIYIVYLPHLIATFAMTPILYRWPGTNISLTKSAIAASSLFALLALVPIILLLASRGGLFLIPIAVISIILIAVWNIT